MSLEAAAIIRLESVDHPEIRSRILNASLNGILLAMPAPRPVGTRMRLTVQIGEPAYEINVSGIIVHVAENKSAPPGFTAQVGVFLTETGPDWAALCRRLAERK
jgi:hypothetical protein